MPSIPATTTTVEDFVSGPATELRKLNLITQAIRELQNQGNNLANVQPVPAGGGNTTCQLFAYAIDENYIGVTWGTICGRQPKDFNAGGFPVFKIGIAETSGFIYAKAVANLQTLQWESAEIILTKDIQVNTTNTAYVLIGSYSKDVVSSSIVVQGVCGSVTVDICTLIPG